MLGIVKGVILVQQLKLQKFRFSFDCCLEMNTCILKGSGGFNFPNFVWIFVMTLSMKVCLTSPHKWPDEFLGLTEMDL